MRRLWLTLAATAGLAAQATWAGQIAPADAAGATVDSESPSAEAERLKAEADARWERLQAETEAAVAARRQAAEDYERGVREAEEARLQYEADMARHRAELERARLEQEDYQRRMREYEADIASGRYRRAGGAERDDSNATVRPAPVVESAADDAERPSRRDTRAPSESCEQQQERNRRRGRAIGSLVGGVASLIGGGASDDGKDGRLAFVPAAQMLGEAIAGLLDCDEQRQAAAATEEAVGGGMGSTARWTSATRPGVSGSSTVVAVDQEADGGECMTVTDIIIVDGEETRAPKRMCRRPPSNRFVRV